MSVNHFFKDIGTIPEFPKIQNLSFKSIIDLPKNVFIHDFTKQYNLQNYVNEFSIGKYNEKRPYMYKSDLFEKTDRYIHMGIDIGAPSGTAVKSFYDGEIFLFKYNNHELDYGYTIITRHNINNQNLYALYGHLSESSIKEKKIGQKIHSGEIFAYLGTKEENGGWAPHIHFQLCLVKPKECDLPGVVSEKEHAIALNVFPDPRIVLGQIY